MDSMHRREDWACSGLQPNREFLNCTHPALAGTHRLPPWGCEPEEERPWRRAATATSRRKRRNPQQSPSRRNGRRRKQRRPERRRPEPPSDAPAPRAGCHRLRLWRDRPRLAVAGL